MLCGHGTTIGVLLMLCGGGAALAQPAPARDALANARALAAAGQSGPARALLEPLTTDEESAGHAHLLLGALDEAAMLVARSDDPASRAEVTSVLLILLDNLAVPA